MNLVAFAQNQRDELRDLGNLAGSVVQPGTHQQTFIATNRTRVEPGLPANTLHTGGLSVIVGSEPPALARCLTAREGGRQDGESCTFIAHTLTAKGADASEDGTGRGTPIVPVVFNYQSGGSQDFLGISERVSSALSKTQTPAVAFTQRTQENGSNLETQDELAYALDSPKEGGRKNGGVCHGMAVRRLLPVECLRLQGAPDDYLDLDPPLSDSAKYAMIGDGVAIPVVEWIAQRIALACKEAETAP